MRTPVSVEERFQAGFNRDFCPLRFQQVSCPLKPAETSNMMMKLQTGFQFAESCFFRPVKDI